MTAWQRNQYARRKSMALSYGAHVAMASASALSAVAASAAKQQRWRQSISGS